MVPALDTAASNISKKKRS